MGDFHRYDVTERVVPVGTPGVTINTVFSALQSYPAPGADGIPVSSGDTTDVNFFGATGSFYSGDLGNVVHTVDPTNYSVTNTTLPDHALYPGWVQRTVEIQDGYYVIHTIGEGTGDLSTMNSALALPVWNFQSIWIRLKVLNDADPTATSYVQHFDELIGKGIDPQVVKRVVDSYFNTPQCFLADTPILMADGSEKPIEDIQIGDEVAAFHPDDRQGLGKTVPKKVTRLFRNTTKTIIDLRGLKMTPGHRVLSDNGEWLTIADVLRNDRCIVEDRKSGAVLVRARTGVEAGSLKDTPIRVQFADPRTGMQRHAIVRAGIPAIAEKLGNNNAKLWTLADVLFDEGYTIAQDGWMILPNGQRFNATPWPASSPLETEMMLDWVISVDGVPFIPPWFASISDEDQAEAVNASPWSTQSITGRTPNRAERRRQASLSIVS